MKPEHVIKSLNLDETLMFLCSFTIAEMRNQGISDEFIIKFIRSCKK